MILNKETGLLDVAIFISSPNYDARPETGHINALVIHAISLPPGCYGGGYIEALFTNCLNFQEHSYFTELSSLRVSTHFLIRRDGEIFQFVPTYQRAWHAGASMLNGRTSVNDFSIGIELEGCDEDRFTSMQYDSLAKLTNVICVVYPAITPERIVGHSDIAPGRKTDPGPCFDWIRYRSSIN